MKNRLLMILLATTTSLFANNIREINFDGLNQISRSVALDIIKISKGDYIDLNKIDKSLKELYKQGYFDDIWVDETNGVLTYYFKEKPVITKIDIDGYGTEDKKDSIISLKKGEVYDEFKIEKAKTKIVESARSEGYFDTVVEVVTNKLNNDKSIEVKFLVNKGENIFIKELSVNGNKNFDKDEIEDALANREAETLGWLWGRNDGKLKLADIEYDSDRIKNLYMKEGFLDTKVSNPFLNVNFDNYSASLKYDIVEGDAYNVSSISIELDRDILDKDELLKDLKLKVDKRFNIEKFRDDIALVKERIANYGYAFVKLYPDFIKDKDKKLVDVKFKAILGSKVYIRDVKISGNTRTLDRVVRREVFLAPKDLYNLTDLKDSTNALRRTGYFDDVSINEVRVSDTELDLVVNVKEASTGSLIFGGGYGSYGGMLLNASLSDKNIFGSGIEPNLAIDYSSKYLRFNAGLYNPRLYDTEYSAGFNAYNSEYEAYDYTDRRKGINLTFGKRFTRHIKGSLTYEYVDSRLSDIDENSTYYEYREYDKHSITPNFTFNNTDDYYLPRSGLIFDSSLEFGMINGIEKDTDFVKSYNLFSVYYGLEDLINYDLILRYKAKFGYISSQENMPVNERFYLGGVRSVRGYESSSVSPRQKDSNGNYVKDEDGDYRLIGGDIMAVNSFEVSVPIIPSAKMRFAFFYDYGMIGENSLSEFQRSSVGGAVEWISPVGPIQLIFAKALDEEEGDRTSTFEFTLGSKF